MSHFLSILLLACITVTAPLTTGEAASKERPYAAVTAWWRAALTDEYRAVGSHGVWDPAAQLFLDMVVSDFSGIPPFPSDGDISRLGQAALGQGCRDGVVILRTATMYDDMPGLPYGRQLLNWAVETLRQEQAAGKVRNPIHMISGLRRQARDPDAALAERARRELPDHVRRLLAAADSDAARRCIVLTMSTVLDPRKVGDGVAADARALIAAPSVDPWLSLVLQGHAEIGQAWQARGSETADTVSAAAQTAFRTHLTVARRHLTAAWKLRSDLPSAAAAMVVVAMGDGVDKPQIWADRAWKADPEDRETYRNLSAALHPRWGGSGAALLAMAQRAASGPWDGPLPGLAEDTVAVVMTDATWGITNRADPRVWAILSTTSKPDPTIPTEAAGLRRLRRIAFAHAFGRSKEALQLFDEAGGLEAPWFELGAAPRTLPIQLAGPGLAVSIQRRRAGIGPPIARKIPNAAAGHRFGDAADRRMSDLLQRWYDAHGQHGAWDAQARTIFGPMIAWYWNDMGAVDPGWPAIVAIGVASPDPLVRMVSRCVPGPEVNAAQLRRDLESDWQALAASPYPAMAAYQAAWQLLRRPGDDAAGRKRLQNRYAETVLAVAQQAGTRVPVPVSLSELLRVPDADAGSIEALEAAAAAPGVDPVIVNGLSGLCDLRRSQKLPGGDPSRKRLAWRAMARLWKAWDATHQPLLAAELTLATSLAGCPVEESRWWFDTAVDGAIDMNPPYERLMAALGERGNADELVAVANEMALAPAAMQLQVRALPFMLSVIGNPSQHDPRRMQELWKAGDSVTKVLLAGTISDSDRTIVLHLRAAFAFLAGRMAEAAQARSQLGAAFDANRLPAGVDRTRFVRDVTATVSEKPAPGDF